MAIYSGFSHQKWWFSIAMLNYQRVMVFNQQNGGVLMIMNGVYPAW